MRGPNTNSTAWRKQKLLMTLRQRETELVWEKKSKCRHYAIYVCLHAFLHVFSREMVLFPLHADYHAAFVPVYCRVNDCRWISRPWESYWETLQQSPNGPYPSPTLMNLSPFLFPLRFPPPPSRLSYLLLLFEIVLIPLPHFPHSLADFSTFLPFLSLHRFLTFPLLLSLAPLFFMASVCSSMHKQNY